MRGERWAWAVLGLAMAVSAALILLTTRGQTFGIDETFYLGRLVEDSGEIVSYPSVSLGYLLAPFNGHLQAGGKAIYELTFALFGANYTAFVLVHLAALFASVALVFELARRRVGALTALAPCVLLLFLGFAREVLLWPFDLHTLVSLALGLAAVLVLQRDSRRADLAACGLIVLSIATIEVGVAILAGIAVWVLLRPDRLQRAWIFVLPLALYAAWWLWAGQFEQQQSAASVANLTLVPGTVFDGLASVLGTLTGTNPIIPATYTTTITWFGKGLAVLAIVALLVRLLRAPVPRTLWVWLTAILVYWALIGVADRSPEGSRYIFVGAVGVLLVAAEAAAGRASNRLAAGVAIVALLALPANVAQLRSGHEGDTLHRDGPVSRSELAMLELASAHVDPGYVPTSDPRVIEAGGGLFFGIPAGAYLRRVEEDGSPAYDLEELRDQEERLRVIADNTLAGALGLTLQEARPPRDRRRCRRVEPQPGSELASFPVTAPQLLLRPASGRRTALHLRRFADSPRAVGIAWLPAGGWSALRLPADGAPEPWRATVDAPVLACPSG